MQNKNKTLAVSIALILTISIATSMTLLPNADAHQDGTFLPTLILLRHRGQSASVRQHIYMWLDAVAEQRRSNCRYWDECFTSSAALTATSTDS
jgi:hypothetical protein